VAVLNPSGLTGELAIYPSGAAVAVLPELLVELKGLGGAIVLPLNALLPSHEGRTNIRLVSRAKRLRFLRYLVHLDLNDFLIQMHVEVGNMQPDPEFLELVCLRLLHDHFDVISLDHWLTILVVLWHLNSKSELVFAIDLGKVGAHVDSDDDFSSNLLVFNGLCLDVLYSLFFNLFKFFNGN